MNPTPAVSTTGMDSHPDRQNFSLILGGPLFQLLCRAHLSDNALHLARKRILVISLVTWLPLLLLSAMEGNLLPGKLPVPFLLDAEVHIRFLLALPLFIAAELLVHQRMRTVVQQFLERQLIPESAMAQFDAAIAAAMKLRNSVSAEVGLIAFVYAFGVLFIWPHYMALDAATWYATPTPDGASFSIAGTWFKFVSIPFFQFILIRWYFRIFIWMRFLWHVSRIDLKLIPTHPDNTGGLGFVSGIVFAFVPLLMAHGALVAGNLANRIFHLDEQLLDFKGPVALVIVALLCLVAGPLLVFTPQLARAKRTGLREYGALAQRYVREFDTKWLRGGAGPDEPLLGSADLQSLADQGTSFAIIRDMKTVPISRDAVLQLIAAVLAPIVPLGLTIMPLEDLVKQLLGIVF